MTQISLRTMGQSAWHRRKIYALICALSLVSSTAWTGTLQGTATYRERIALPKDAVFEVELQDISRADAPAAVLGRTKVDPAGQPPLRFEIAYDDASVQAGRRYAVRATVKHRGRLLFTTARVYPVLDGRNAPLLILLIRARGGLRTGSTVDDIGVLPASFEGELPGAGNAIAWHVDLLPEGRYRLRMTHVGQPEPNRFDDIGRWTRDESGRLVLRGGREAPVFLIPVEGGTALRNLDLFGEPIESGQRQPMEEGRRPQTTLVVERFIAVWPRQSCGNTLAAAPLRGTYWKLVRLGEEPVIAATTGLEAYLAFASDEARVVGSGGCNRVMGGFRLDGDWLRFGRMASSRMSCPDRMDQEKRFLEALEHVQRYRIRGSHLELLDATGAVSARFEAVALE